MLLYIYTVETIKRDCLFRLYWKENEIMKTWKGYLPPLSLCLYSLCLAGRGFAYIFYIGANSSNSNKSVYLMILRPLKFSSFTRLIAGTLCQYYYTFGYILMAFIAYFLNFNWQLLQAREVLNTK